MRKLMGRKLAAIAPAKADMVISSPDSGTVAAILCGSRGLPYDIGIIKNRYIGRAFIEPDKELRDMAVQIKLNDFAIRWKASRSSSSTIRLCAGQRCGAW